MVRPDETECRNGPHQTAQQYLPQLDAMGDQIQIAVEYADRLIHRTAGIELQNTQVDQVGQKTVFFVEGLTNPLSDRAQACGLYDGRIIWRKNTRNT